MRKVIKFKLNLVGTRFIDLACLSSQLEKMFIHAATCDSCRLATLDIGKYMMKHQGKVWLLYFLLLVLDAIKLSKSTHPRRLRVYQVMYGGRLIFKTTKLLKVNDIIKLQELKFYYKFETNLLQHYLQSLPFQLNTNSHGTRSQNRNVQSRPMHEYAKKCIQYNIPNTVNNIATNIIDQIYTHGMQGHMGYVKQSLLQFY